MDHAEVNGDYGQRLESDAILSAMRAQKALEMEQVRQYIGQHLKTDVEERAATSAKIIDKASGILIWAEMVVSIVNEANEDGVSGEVVLSMLDNISPSRQDSRQGKLDDLYTWKLSRMSSREMSQVLVLMQWVMLSPEPLTLNELLVAMRLTMLTWPKAGMGKWDAEKTLDVEPAMSMKDLRNLTSDERGIPMDSPTLFWRWINRISQGLLRLHSTASADEVSSEPLALQRVQPADESVRVFFLSGKGFQSLLPQPEDPRARYRSMEQFIDDTYCSHLHACLRYLNMTDLESLGRGTKALYPATNDVPLQEKAKWRKYAEDQRRMVMSSYPFLRYAVENLVYYLLCPRMFRYFLPQKEFLDLFTANSCRIWRRWTHLLGFSISDADPATILNRASQGTAKQFLDPVYGAKYRLERVLRTAWKTVKDQQRVSTPGSAMVSSRVHLRSRSDVSEHSVVFRVVGKNDARWLVPKHSRSKSASPTVLPSVGSPKRPAMYVPHSIRALAGIQEVV